MNDSRELRIVTRLIQLVVTRENVIRGRIIGHNLRNRMDVRVKQNWTKR